MTNNTLFQVQSHNGSSSNHAPIAGEQQLGVSGSAMATGDTGHVGVSFRLHSFMNIEARHRLHEKVNIFRWEVVTCTYLPRVHQHNYICYLAVSCAVAIWPSSPVSSAAYSLSLLRLIERMAEAEEAVRGAISGTVFLSSLTHTFVVFHFGHE